MKRNSSESDMGGSVPMDLSLIPSLQATPDSFLKHLVDDRPELTGVGRQAASGGCPEISPPDR